MRIEAVPLPGFEILDTADPSAILAYERAFFRAFAPIRPAGLLRRLWLWDDAAERIAAPIPYADQVVYVLRDASGQVRRGMAVNLALRQVQAARFGFTVPVGPGRGEMLTFFADGPHDLRGALRFRRQCYADLRARGLREGYGTARRRPLQAYGRFGTEVVDERVLEGEARYLLRFDLAQDYSQPHRRLSGSGSDGG